ncbi:MAG: CsgG/HfaB family protein [Acidobacteriota bacterium]|nr:CsgG/HfaB family protein [Blastocatellia bacterium]MDW8413452.1 CsgG/HfaB family protein [Acidobacteriota bacterium]
MKLGVFLSVLILLGGIEIFAQGGKKKIFVVAGSSHDKAWTNDIIAGELENAVVASGKFTLLSRSAMDTIIKEQKLAQSDLANPASAAQIGRILTADYALIGKCLNAEVKNASVNVPFAGTVTKVKLNATVQMQLIKVETSEVIDSAEYTDKAEKTASNFGSSGTPGAEDFRAMMKKFAKQFVDKLSLSIPIEALVVLIKGSEVAIDAGSEASVRPGMEFEVYSEGEPIRNAAGEILAYDRTVHARIRVARVEPKIAWCSIVQTFNENGQPDAVPSPARIKRDQSVRQVGVSSK